MEYIQILFDDLTVEKKEMLIALLAYAGFESFEEEDNSLKAYITSGNLNLSAFNSIIKLTDVRYSKSIIKEINWNEKWESDFEPVRVPDFENNKPFVYIRANFHNPNPLFLHDIIVTPKMSFGTGHHATTFLMVSQMSCIDFRNKSVIDFGTGTGVLAILSEKLGCASVVAIDNDDWSINNALENRDINLCRNVKVVKAETVAGLAAVDIILANINLNVIIANLPAIKEAALPGGIILFSGILLNDEETLINHIAKTGLIINTVLRRENWLSISVVNK